MSSVLVIQGAGMDERGKKRVEVFGPETIDQINAQIRQGASDMALTVEIMQSNDVSEVVQLLQSLTPNNAPGFVAGVINPAGFTTLTGALPDAISKLPFPMYEVHASNPASRGVISAVLPVCRGAICGFGYTGYQLALQAIKGQTESLNA
jgi:3-dehydroquinate dehydratase-2